MLAIGDAFFGLGLTVVELALIVLAVPPIITNSYLGVDGVDPELVDAARGMGMSELEVLGRVELPLALPLIFAGLRTASVFVVSTTTIASLAGFSGDELRKAFFLLDERGGYVFENLAALPARQRACAAHGGYGMLHGLSSVGPGGLGNAAYETLIPRRTHIERFAIDPQPRVRARIM